MSAIWNWLGSPTATGLSHIISLLEAPLLVYLAWYRWWRNP